MRRFSIVTAIIALTFAVMPAATAQSSVLHAEFEGVGIPNFDPAAVAERCPDPFGWIYNTEGSGTMETTAFRGEFKAIGQHCSRWLIDPPTDPDRAYPGKVGNGMLTFYTADGDLVIHYQGKFRFRGDLSIDPPEYTSKIVLYYKVDGDLSTGVFAGATGVGVMRVIDKFEAGVPSFTTVMRGPISFAS